jgi:hypothetical protein
MGSRRSRLSAGPAGCDSGQRGDGALDEVEEGRRVDAENDEKDGERGEHEAGAQGGDDLDRGGGPAGAGSRP